MGFHFLLGKLLLEDSGTEVTHSFITSTFVCIPMFLGVVAVYHCSILLIKNSVTAAALMVIILVIVPKEMSLLSYKIPQIKRISDMLMLNLMQVELVENISGGYQRSYTWDTTGGMIRCIIAGICAIVIFL